MRYYIASINKDGYDWAILESNDLDYITRVFNDLSLPPGYTMELRETAESLDTHLNYNVLRTSEEF